MSTPLHPNQEANAVGHTMEPLLLSLSDVYRMLGRANAENMIRAGWLKPRSQRPTTKGERGIYWRDDVLDCAARVRDGEYPNQKAS